MQTLSSELKAVIGRRLERADSREILTIASALCVDEAPPAAQPDTVQRIQPRFEIVDDDIVLDHSTGLMWARDHVPGGKRNWGDSMQAASKLDLRGWTWRAPSIREQLSIVDYERHDPAFDTDVFRGGSDWVWTSTPLHSSPGVCAWIVNFNYGLAFWGDRSNYGFVRAVRVGQF